MTIRERFLQVINSKGYESVNQLMIAVETVICGNKEEGIWRATNNRNYSKMIDGKERDFPREYIIALEKILNMRYVDVINSDYENRLHLQFDSIRTIAYANDYDKTKEFDLK